MKHLFSISILLLSIVCRAQPINYNDWQLEAKKDSRMLPEYGGKPRTTAEKAEDDTYIKTTMEELASSRESSSQQMVELGFKYLGNGDMRVAMLRFNQAWLLNPKNSDVYSGFGSVYFMLGDMKQSLHYYNKGLTLDPKNTNLLTYSARSHIATFEITKTDTAAFFRALPLLNKSYRLEPKNAYTTFLLSRYYIRAKNCDSAVKYYKECKKSGGQPITEQFTKAINQICGGLMK